VFPLQEEGNPVLFMFKNSAASHVGDLLYFKVYGGLALPGMDLQNATTGEMVRLSNLYLTNGEQRTEVDKVVTGDIGAAVKLKETGVNDTLHQKGHPIKLEPIHFPSPVIRT